MHERLLRLENSLYPVRLQDAPRLGVAERPQKVPSFFFLASLSFFFFFKVLIFLLDLMINFKSIFAELLRNPFFLTASKIIAKVSFKSNNLESATG